MEGIFVQGLYKPILDMAGMEELKQAFETIGNTVMVSGCVDTQKVHFTEAISQQYKFKVIITYDEMRAHELLEDVQFFNKNCIAYPAKDFIFYSADIHGHQIVGQRIKCIDKILQMLDSEGSLTVVTTIDGLTDLLVPIQRYIDHTIHCQLGDKIDVEQLIKQMLAMGYERVGMVDVQGQFAVRGGIIDIYSHTDETPVRIELWDDEIDSIRFFDVQSQRSIEKTNKYSIFPATECLITEGEIEEGLQGIKGEAQKQIDIFSNDKNCKKAEQMEHCNHIRRLLGDLERNQDYNKYIYTFVSECVSFLSYFPQKDTLFVLDEPNRIDERMKLVQYEYEESSKNRIATGYMLPSQANLLIPVSKIYNKLNSSRLLIVSMLDYKPKQLKVAKYVRVEARGINSYNNSFEYLAEDLKKYKRQGYQTILVCNSRTRAKRIVKDLTELEVTASFMEYLDHDIEMGSIVITCGNIHKGFEYPLLRLVVIAENDIFTSKNRKKQRKKQYNGKSISQFNELNIGDYVIHEDHGVGIYRGIEKICTDGTQKDYIKIDYADNTNLYVLATQLDRLQKYMAADTEKKPKVNRIGAPDWHRTKSKVSRAVEEIAKDLVELYAQRQQKKGYRFNQDTVWQSEFEEMFPYEETPDQLSAIEDTKRDMESERIMDRLICGDVGYGKTEVAIRAAFKAVQEGKQVAYLVPTTILAQQHYNTFEERMKSFPVTVAQLSSFRTSKQIKQTLIDLKKGFVDIIIGTHRLLSKDVEFKDLGLLVIDEEQRFGVAHKEKIKKLKNNIDVLTLSATPIPRTLHMSLVGIRDMSVLEEPPVDRLPIQTFVTEHNDEMIREAINRELARNGQVYYVYNRVQNMDEVAAHVSALVPDALVEFAHGQMDKRQLERIMSDFIAGKIDVLISTTIIETGMDISNVNTMIIEDAEKFGLSQLYQLRGRVGRSNRTAYAFLLYRRDKMLSEVAEKRLHAIREFSDLGSGFKIAMKDLEIRGAGNVLGKSQHGHMAAVGYDLYCKLLNEAVNNLKGIKNEYEFETKVDVMVDAYLPPTYIKSEYQKLDIYKRIAAIETLDELSDMEDELQDRYGSLEPCAKNLLQIALIKAKAHKVGIMEIKGGLDDESRPPVYRTEFKIYSNTEINRNAIQNFMNCYGGAIRFTNNKNIEFVWRVVKKKFKNQGEYLKGMREVVETMEKQLVNG